MERAERPERVEREGQESRRERQQREREERLAKKAAAAEVVAQEESRQINLPETEAGDEGEESVELNTKPELADGEEPRRRRRRGGRNRNRRDREAGDNPGGEAGVRDSSDDFVPVADLAHAEQQLGTHSVEPEQPFAAVEASVTHHAHEETPAPVSFAEPATAHVVEPEAVTAAVTTAVVTEAVAAVPTQVELTFEPAAPVVAAPAHPVAESVAEVAPAVTPEVVVDAAPVVAEAAPVVEAVEVIPAPVAVPVVAAPAPVQSPAPAPAPAQTPAPAVKAEDLNDMLASAGLVLASTDPEKLRHAQTYATPVNEVRPVRVRKAPVQVSNEPLQLVQTKQPPQ